jgi:uncharacterized protein
MLVGVIHLPALPGSPQSKLSVSAIAKSVAADTRALVRAGFDAVIVENYGDVPFFKARVPAVTVSAMTALALTVRETAPKLSVGINVLRNDGLSALAIAACVGADFIRVNVLAGARVTDQGIIEGDSASLLRERSALFRGKNTVGIWADVDVKHSAPLGPVNLVQEVEDVVHRGMASAVLVTGDGTGKQAPRAKLEAVRSAAGVPVYVASGASEAALPELAGLVDGVIVGSALRKGSRAGLPIDAARAARFARAYRKSFRV